MQRNSGAKNFWKTETKEVQQALKNAAVKAARKNNFGYGLTGAFKSEVKALKEEFGELKAMFAKFMELNKSENT